MKKRQSVTSVVTKKPEPEAQQAQVVAVATTENELAIIPAGTFKMGDLTGNGLPNERPIVEKVLSHSYAMQSTLTPRYSVFPS